MKVLRLSLLACASLLAFPALAQDQGYSTPTATNTEMRLSAQEEQIRQLNGRLEQVEFALRRMDNLLQRMQGDADARLTHLENVQTQAQAVQAAQAAAQAQAAAAQAQAQAQAQTQAAQQQVVADVNGTLGAIKMQNGKVTGGINKPQQPPLPQVPADYGLTPVEQYERAFSLLRDAQYLEAEQAFKGFIDKNPQDKLIDNAKYWYAETLYVRGRFDDSAVAFADAYQQNPKGTKAPDSLLKLGMSLGALNKTQDACVTLSELKTKYPNASPTVKTRADEERSKLKCGR